MEELLYTIEIIKENGTLTVRVDSDYGGSREFRSTSIEDALEQFVIEYQEEFDSM